jgi:hypothetical protein
VNENAESVRLHLCVDMPYQERLVRFIENHDEHRAATTFSSGKERAAAVTMATLPGARLFHEGQFEGRKVRLSVFLGRRTDEPPDEDLTAFYKKLLQTVKSPVFGRVSGAFASVQVGPTIQAIRTWWPGAGRVRRCRVRTIDIWSWSISATAPCKPMCIHLGTT